MEKLFIDSEKLLIDSEDRISKLPEPILHHILCSLSQKEAIKTCVLSKAWRYLARTRPKIDFCFTGRDALDSALDQILQACHDRNLLLDEFAVWLSSDDNMTSLVNKWIPTVIQNMCVKTFQLSSDKSDEPQLFQLPLLIIESHHIQNLSLYGCSFKSYSSTTTTHEVLVYLQTLRLTKVEILEEILDSILSNSPFLKDLTLQHCKGFKRIKLSNNNNNKPTNLARFYFTDNPTRRDKVSIEIGDEHLQTLTSVEIERCSLKFSHNKPLEFAHHRQIYLTKMQLSSDSIPCHFTELFLHDVKIPEEVLDIIFSDCPLVEDVTLYECRGFRRITMSSNKPTNLARFNFSGRSRRRSRNYDVSIEIGDCIQTLRSIEIEHCLFSFSHNKPLECGRLTRLSLTSVIMLSELFTCNFHSLEELKLIGCYGIKEFKLSSRSMKRLDIHNNSKPFRVTVDAPSIVSFNYEGILPQSISFATTSSGEWKAKINLGYYPELSQGCFNELYGLLKAIGQSEISLELDRIYILMFGAHLHIGDDGSTIIDHIVSGVSEEAKHELPIAVEHLRIKWFDYRNVDSSVDPFLNMLFHMFRPSFIYMSTDMLKDSNYERSREIAELLFKERETERSYFWQRGLEEVSLQVLYWKQSEWQPVEYTSFTEVSKKCADRKLEIRIQLKWRDH